MAYELYELRHKRENQYITRSTHKEAVREYAHQWRDEDGSIPWRMFCIMRAFPDGPVVNEYEVNPWTGEIIS